MPISETTFERDLRKWTRLQMPKLTAKQRDDFAAFTDWIRENDIETPAGGEVVAEYLVELVLYGYTLDEIQHVARSIELHYQLRGAFLDPWPIKGALAMAQAQFGDRTLN
jgi:hypothetical protein